VVAPTVRGAIFHNCPPPGGSPLRLARSSNPDVWVERYGSLQGGDLELALTNDTPDRLFFDLRLPIPSACPAAISSLEEISNNRSL